MSVFLNSALTNDDMKRTTQKRQLFNQLGQSIIEVLIATGVVGAILTAVAATLTFSVKNSAENKYRAVATTKAQEAIEVFRRERSFLGWETFVSSLGGGGVYCLNTLPPDSASFTTMTSSECEVGIAEAGTEFTREAVVTFPTASSVRVQSIVTWYDGVMQRDVTVTQELFQSAN